MSAELPSVQSYECVVRAFLTVGDRAQALAAFAQLMHAHPTSGAARALLVELFQMPIVDGGERDANRCVLDLAMRDV